MDRLRNWRIKSSKGGSNQFGSLNHITDIDETFQDQTRMDESFREGDDIRLNDFPARNRNSYDSGGASRGPQWITHAYFADNTTGPIFPQPPSMGSIVIHTDVKVEVCSATFLELGENGTDQTAWLLRATLGPEKPSYMAT